MSDRCQQHTMYDPTCPQCQWGTKTNEQSSLASATGSAAGVESEKCPKCWGQGNVYKSDYLLGKFYPMDYCPYEVCKACNGSGLVKQAKPQPNEKLCREAGQKSL